MSKQNLKRAKVHLMPNLHHSLDFCHRTRKQLLVAAKCIEVKEIIAEIKKWNIHICNIKYSEVHSKAFYYVVQAVLGIQSSFGDPRSDQRFEEETGSDDWLVAT